MQQRTWVLQVGVLIAYSLKLSDKPGVAGCNCGGWQYNTCNFAFRLKIHLVQRWVGDNLVYFAEQRNKSIECLTGWKLFSKSNSPSSPCPDIIYSDSVINQIRSCTIMSSDMDISWLHINDYPKLTSRREVQISIGSGAQFRIIVLRDMQYKFVKGPDVEGKKSRWFATDGNQMCAND